MNAIVTLDFGNYLHPKTRRSFAHAAERWGCDFIALKEPLKEPGARKVHHFWQKTLLPFAPEIGGKYDRLAVFDGDMLIRNDCPSLFDKVPKDGIGVVCRDQPGHRCMADRHGKIMFWAKKLNLPPADHSHFVNGGLAIYSPIIHMEYLKAWKECGRMVGWRPKAGSDQTSLSVILAGMNAPVAWLPWEFNTLRVPKRNSPLGRMATFIYHFNSGGGKAGYHSRVEKCDWRRSQ